MATQPLSVIADTFEAFVIVSGPLTGKGQTQPIQADAADLAEAIAFATNRTPHKGHFYVRHTDGLTGAVMLSFYVVKRKSQPAYRYHEYRTRAMHDLYAEHLFDLDGSAL